MIQSPLAAATDGYLAGGPFFPLSVASQGYLAIIVVVEVPVSVPGGGKPFPKTYRRRRDQLEREDDEVLTIFMIAVIYGYLE